MPYRLLMLATSSLIVAALAMPVNAQQGTGGSAKMQDDLQQKADQPTSVHYRDDDRGDWHRRGMMRDDDDRGDWHHRGMMRDRDDDGRGGWHHRGMMRDRDDGDECYGRGMMRGGRGDWDRGEMMRGWRDRMEQRGWGAGMMGHGMMMRMMMVLADTDNDGSVSLQEFQAVHERMFKAMDANKDGNLTMDELQGFMAAPRSPAQPQQ
jgi:hypothetical protein